MTALESTGMLVHLRICAPRTHLGPAQIIGGIVSLPPLTDLLHRGWLQGEIRPPGPTRPQVASPEQRWLTSSPCADLMWMCADCFRAVTGIGGISPTGSIRDVLLFLLGAFPR